MVKGSVTRPTGVMSEKETMEAFLDGARKAAASAREMAKETSSAEWLNVAMTLDALHDGGRQLADMKSMSRLETMMAANLKMNPKGFIH